MEERYYCHTCYKEGGERDKYCASCGEELPGPCGECGDGTSPCDAVHCVACGIRFGEDDEDS